MGIIGGCIRCKLNYNGLKSGDEDKSTRTRQDSNAARNAEKPIEGEKVAVPEKPVEAEKLKKSLPKPKPKKK